MKAMNFQLLAVSLTGFAYATVLSDPAAGAELPVPCIASICGSINGPLTWKSSGEATWVQSGTGLNTLTINQTSNTALLNWKSFNISADGKVIFNQPNANSLAVNRIFQADPSRIQGQLTANGQIYLINQNGIVFNRGSQIDVAGLIASSLDITNTALNQGVVRAAGLGDAAFARGNGANAGAVIVENGASLKAQSGGRVFLFAPTVVNEGSIEAPDGQVMLAAGSKVYLFGSTDPGLRGLLVEVEDGGEVTNGAIDPASGVAPGSVGSIAADRGNVTLLGMAVNQNGRISANTSVRANGSIRLLAREGTLNGSSFQYTQAGDVILSGGSVTQTLPDLGDASTTVDANAQPVSTISMEGKFIHLETDSEVRAPGGLVQIAALSLPDVDVNNSQADDSRVLLETGSVIDVSGSDVTLSVERNVIPIELRADQIKDNPYLKDSALRGKKIYVDIRKHGTRADGTEWIGTPLVDTRGDIGTIARNVAERTSEGGTVAMKSQGDIVTEQGSIIDVSGGTTTYTAGNINTSFLTTQGKLVDVSQATPDRSYDSVVNAVAVAHPKWGVTESFATFSPDLQGGYEAGYLEGKDAGTVRFVAPHLLLAGKLDGHVTSGLHQRQAPTELVSGAIRSFEETPLAGALVIGSLDQGRNKVLDADIILTDAPAPAVAFNPETDPFPASINELRLSPAMLAASGMGRLSLYGRRSIVIPVDDLLSLPAGGSLTGNARNVDVLGTIRIPSGTVQLTATPFDPNDPDVSHLAVGPSARIDVSGRWVNDNPLVSGGEFQGPALISGGNVSLNAVNANLRLDAGSVVEASGGAWVKSDQSVTFGSGGKIKVGTSGIVGGESPTMEVAGSMAAYSFATGGSLELSSASVCIDGDGAACNSMVSSPGLLALTSALFSHGGFANYTVTSNAGGLTLKSGTSINPLQENYVLPANYTSIESGAVPGEFAQVIRLADELRRPANLTLQSIVNPSITPTEANLPDFALTMEHGSSIATDPGASVTLRSNAQVVIDGSISTPAGDISVALTNSLSIGSFLNNQGIWLDDGAILSARGLVQYEPNSRQLRTGNLLDGGTIDIRAERGYIVAAPRSVIDVSGDTGTFDRQQSAQSIGAYARVPVGTSAGSVRLTAAEGMLLSGSFKAKPGQDNLFGGDLTIELDAANRKDPGSGGGDPLFPVDARTISLADAQPPIVVEPGTSVPTLLRGQATVSTRSIESAGFDRVALRASSIQTPTTIQPGRVAWNADVGLNVRESILIDAATMQGTSGVLNLHSNYVAIGHSDRLTQVVNDPALGTAGLEVNAGLIDLYGDFSVSGVANVDLNAASDVRLRGVFGLGDDLFTGSMTTAGSITLSAEQVYPSTLTRFEIKSIGDGSQISIKGTGAPSSALSVGGILRMSAATIEIDGTVRAPAGAIELNAQTIHLGKDGALSVSMDGQTIPFGETQGGFDWVYPLSSTQTRVFGSNGAALPDKRISLNAVDIRTDPGSVIDLSAGGKIFASEFVPGVGGSRDILDASVSPNSFAIIPAADLAFAPFDQMINEGFVDRPGATVVIGAGSEIPAGTYVKLPPRYALMPGAYLLTSVRGYDEMPLGTAVKLADGTAVVTGYESVGGAGTRSGRMSGYTVLNRSAIDSRAAYSVTFADNFFRDPVRADVFQAARLPNDAGILQLSASNSLALDGSLLAAKQPGGRGAAVDIAADRIRVVADATTLPESGVLQLDAGQLNDLNAESLLLGGRRQTDDLGATGIEIVASDVTMADGAVLQAPELALVALDQVNLDGGAALVAEGSVAGAPSDIRLPAAGALVYASTGARPEIARAAGAGGSGSILLNSGSRIAAGKGTVILDAARNVVASGILDADGGALAVGSSQISLGAAPDGTEGFILSNSELNSLTASELSLRSAAAVKVYGAVEINVDQFEINAPGMAGTSTGASTANIHATRVLLNNSGGQSAQMVPGVAPDHSSIRFDAKQLQLGDGVFGISGFQSIELSASEAVVGAGAHELSSLDASSLVWSTPLVTVENGAKLSVNAPNARFEIQQSAGAPANTVSAGLGGSFTANAGTIELGSTIALPSGRLELNATRAGDGAITFLDTARVDLAGRSLRFDGVDVGLPGGSVTLEATEGGVDLRSASTINVAGSASGGQAGAIFVLAQQGRANLAGELSGGASSGSAGGRFSVNAQNFGNFDALAAKLNEGGFTTSQNFHQWGPGDLTLSAGSVLRAGQVSVINESGAINVAGLIDASGGRSSDVAIAARGDVQISGTVDIHGDGNTRTLELSSTIGGVLLNSSGKIVAGGGGSQQNQENGSLIVSVSRERLLELVDADPANDHVSLAGSISGVKALTIEGQRSYDDVDGIIDFANVDPSIANPLFADASDFMTQGAGVVNTLLGSRSEILHATLRPGIEIRSPGDLALSADWNLADWRFDGQAGRLTLRAGGNLRFDASLSDGFFTPDTFEFEPIAGPSWSYNLVAGADLTSVDSHSVTTGVGGGDLIIGAGEPGGEFPGLLRMIRTGTGDIRLTAARDVLFSNQASVVYTAGQVVDPSVRFLAEGLAYAENGGNVMISAGRDVVGAVTRQSFNEWLWRVGSNSTNDPVATAWNVYFPRFENNVAALSGGDVSVVAGGSVKDLSASVPTTARAGASPQSTPSQSSGGDLSIRAGDDIQGGVFLMMRGHGEIRAGGQIGAGSNGTGSSLLNPVLALGDGAFDVVSTNDLSLESVVNPTIVTQGTTQPLGPLRSYFLTYTDTSAVNLLSVAGDVALHNDYSALARSFTSTIPTVEASQVLVTYPGSLRAVAASGSIRLQGSFDMVPSPSGNLELFADDDIEVGAVTTVVMSDAGRDRLPTVNNASRTPQSLIDALAPAATDPSQVHASTPVHADDQNPIRIVANHGDVVFDPGSGGFSNALFLPKQTRILAGRDVSNMRIAIQNTRESDDTLVQAGRDIIASTARTEKGLIAASDREILVDGPGRVDVIAGRNINLGPSNGIATRGNRVNPALADRGADIGVLAGLNGESIKLTEFTQAYLIDGSDYDDELFAYVAEKTGVVTKNKTAALTTFANLRENERLPLIEQIFFAELLQSGRSAATTGSNDYTRGFSAINRLLPLLEPTNSGGEGDPAYRGDLNLFFSRIYTLDGGDIDLLAPGGTINVGLSTPPTSFGVLKPASQLGIVAQGQGDVNIFSLDSVLVNESRIFAADSGSILIWTARGDIDAGRGAKTAISAPPPNITIDTNGNINVEFPPALAGSGIRAFVTTAGAKAGGVDLYAPFGAVIAGDAGIGSAGNVTIGAVDVVGADNIQVGGTAVGVSVDTAALGANFASASSTSGSASASTEGGLGGGDSKNAPLAQTALSWLDVFVLGLGEDNCKQDDMDCLKRQKKN